MIKFLEHVPKKKHDILFQHKEPGNSLFVILKGRVYIFCIMKLQDKLINDLIREFSININNLTNLNGADEIDSIKRISCSKALNL